MFVLAAALTAAVLVPTSEASAALNAYLKLKGQKQGDIKGSLVQKGREGGIRVLSVSHEIVSPRDPASGLPTGKRQHKPFVFTLEIDRSTPLLLNAIAKNEVLSAASFEMPATKDGPAQYRVTLTNASIAAFEFVTLPETNATALKISLTYQKIEWTWLDGGVTAMDDWETPVSKKL